MANPTTLLFVSHPILSLRRGVPPFHSFWYPNSKFLVYFLCLQLNHDLRASSYWHEAASFQCWKWSEHCRSYLFHRGDGKRNAPKVIGNDVSELPHSRMPREIICSFPGLPVQASACKRPGRTSYKMSLTSFRRRDRSQPYSPHLHLSWRSYAFTTMHRVSPPPPRDFWNIRRALLSIILVKR